MKKALIMPRVSSFKQVNDGSGLQSQEFRCRKYCEERGYPVVAVFPDEGVSGAILERPAIIKALAYIDAHRHDEFVVVFDDISRIARDVNVHWDLKRAFESRGAKIESPNYHFEDSPEGKFIETVLAGKSQLDREQNRRQVCQKMKARLEDGYAVFCPPTGMEYKKHPVHKKLLSPKEPIAGVLKEGIEGFAHNLFLGQVDLQNFYESKKDILGKKKVHLEFVKRTLTEILYTGYIEYSDWEVSRRKGHHQGFISIETFDKVQEKLKRSEKQIRETDRPEYPLRRLVDCAVCKKTMTASAVKGKRRYYAVYTCNNRACTAKPKNIQKKILEEEYVELLDSITPKTEILELTEAIALDKWKEINSNLKASKKGQENDIKQRECEIEKYVELIGKTHSDIVREQYEAKIEKLMIEVRELKGRPTKSMEFNFEEALKEVLAFVGTPANHWENASPEGKFMIHRLIFNRNPAFDAQNGFGTPQTTLPFAIKEFLDSSNPQLVEMPGIEPGSKDNSQKRLPS